MSETKASGQLQKYKGSLPSSLLACMSVAKKLSQEFQQFEEDTSYSPSLWDFNNLRVRTIGYPVVLLACPQRGREEVWWKTCIVPRDMDMWIAKKNSHKKILPGKMPHQVPAGRKKRRADLNSDPLEESSDSFSKKWVTNTIAGIREALNYLCWSVIPPTIKEEMQYEMGTWPTGGHYHRGYLWMWKKVQARKSSI